MLQESQGVKSYLEFPLGQDELAITKAINDLLKEGWIFSLNKNSITMERSWEYEEMKGMIEKEKKNNKNTNDNYRSKKRNYRNRRQ